SGTILIMEDAVLPETLLFDSEPFVPGWKLVKNLGGDKLDREIGRAGWTFFFLAGEISSTVFGNDGPATVRRAVKRILANSKLEKFNSLEVTRVTSKHFLGVPYTTVRACSRHVWKSIFLFRREDVGDGGREEPSRGLSERRGSTRNGGASGRNSEPVQSTAPLKF
ncbi:MAG: hypothetical protein ACREHV_11040, partial [Rhizomicrobium sp.]